jgi:hypothetical protein
LAVAKRHPPDIQVYDTESGAPVATLIHTNDLHRLDWSPDGRWLAAPSDDGGVYVWDLSRTSSAPARVLAGHDRCAFSVCFDRQGELLLSQSWDQTTAFWSWPSGNLILKYGGTDARLIFSLDGRSVGPFIDSSKVRVLEVSHAPEHRVLPSNPAPTDCNGVFSPDGRWVVVPGACGLECWDVQEWKCAWVEPVSPPRYLAFHPAGDRLMVSGTSGLHERAWILAASNGPPRLGPAHEVTSRRSGPLQYSGDGAVCVMTDVDGLRVQFSSGSEPRLLPMNMCNFASVSPDAKWAAASAWDGLNSDVVVWEFPAGREVLRLARTQGDVQFSGDRRWLVIMTGTLIQCRAVGTWQKVAEGALERGQGQFALSTDSRWCAAKRGLQQILLCELPAFRPIFTLDAPSEAPISFSPDNRLLLTRRSNGQFCLWDLSLMRQELTAIGLGW